MVVEGGWDKQAQLKGLLGLGQRDDVLREALYEWVRNAAGDPVLKPLLPLAPGLSYLAWRTLGVTLAGVPRHDQQERWADR